LGGGWRLDGVWRGTEDAGAADGDGDDLGESDEGGAGSGLGCVESGRVAAACCHRERLAEGWHDAEADGEDGGGRVVAHDAGDAVGGPRAALGGNREGEGVDERWQARLRQLVPYALIVGGRAGEGC